MDRSINVEYPLKEDEEDVVDRIHYPLLKEIDGVIEPTVMSRDDWDYFTKTAGTVFKQELEIYYNNNKDFVKKGDWNEVKKDISMIRRKALDYGLYKTTLDKSNVYPATAEDFINIRNSIKEADRPTGSGYKLDIQNIGQ